MQLQTQHQVVAVQVDQPLHKSMAVTVVLDS
jgi:hypothetical protein